MKSCPSTFNSFIFFVFSFSYSFIKKKCVSLRIVNQKRISLNSDRAKYILETTKQMHAWILQKFSEKTKH